MRRIIGIIGLIVAVLACGWMVVLRKSSTPAPKPQAVSGVPAKMADQLSGLNSRDAARQATPPAGAAAKQPADASPAKPAEAAGPADGPANDVKTAPTGQPVAGDTNGPPDMLAPPVPLSLSQQVRRFVEEMKGAAGPEIAEHARTMLVSSDAVMRAVGAAMLADADALDEEQLKAIAEDKELSVPFSALEWLTDMGREKDAADLRGKLLARGLPSETIRTMLQTAALRGGGERAALDLLRSQMSASDAAALYVGLACDGNQSYALRMKAAIELRDVLPFDGYRSTATDVQTTTVGNDPAWDEGIRRLNERLQGPAEILQAPPSLTPSDVDEMLAREYPMMLEDLALRVDYLIGHSNSTVSAGTATRLTERLKALRNQPLTDDDQATVRRLEKAVERVEAIEQERPAPPTEGPPLSAGAVQAGAGG